MKKVMALLLTLSLFGVGYGQIIQANYKSPLSDLQKQGWQIHSHSLSFDEQTVIFSARAPQQTHYDLYTARKNAKVWEHVTALTALNTPADELYPTLSSSEQDIMFVRRTVEVGKGKKPQELFYLMCSNKASAQWSVPEVVIISCGNDISPVMLPDNKTVIFASSRTVDNKKNNNFALFYTQRIDQRNWYDPMLILAPENKNEHYYAPYIKHLVRQGNVCNVTIGYTHQICNNRDTTYIAEQLVLPDQFHPQPILTLEGRIRDVKTKRIAPAHINVFHAISFKPLAQIQSGYLGTYKLALPAGIPYFVDITGEHYSHHYCEYDCTQLKADTTIKANIELDKQLNIRINAYDSDILLPISPDSILLNGQAIKRATYQTDIELNIGGVYDITYKKKGYEDTTLHINTQNSILLTRSELDIEMLPCKNQVTIRVVDADSLYLVPAVVEIRNKHKDEVLKNLSNDSLHYITSARQENTYLVYVRAKGYIYKDTLIHIPNAAAELTYTIPLSALQKEMVLQLRNIQFDHNSSVLTTSSYAELDKLVKLMQDNPSMQIELSAHTDDVGSEQYNMRLSQQRGESVRKYLIRKGVVAKRIIAKGYGKNKPLVPNDSDENRAINRRVEFTINEIE